jgi:hypothetical protein
VEDRDLGQASRLAAATGAYLCFEDEAGQNLRPPRARTWAPRGHTPIVRVSGKGSARSRSRGCDDGQPDLPGGGHAGLPGGGQRDYLV